MARENDPVSSEDREECLEALCRLEQAHQPLNVAILATDGDLAGKPLADLLLDLAMSGDVMTEGASFRLTKKGRQLGRRIIRRHELAERILCALGLKRDTAHRGACRLEHVLSDEDAGDLAKHMEVVMNLIDVGGVTLAQAEPGQLYRVRWIRGGAMVRKRLEDMGLGQGSLVTVCHKQSGGPVEVEAHGACVALGRGVALHVLVTPESR